MATKRTERKTEKVNVWLEPQQAEWLKSKKNISETVRALITEAMNMEKLAQSVKSKGAGGRAQGAGKAKSKR
jgi:hypothetical protein